MLNRIIRFSVENKLIIGLFTLALVLYGAFEVTKLPIDAVPDITDNQVQIITVSPSLGAPDVERLVTFPIEQANRNIPGIKEIRSFSRFGLSLVTIVFNESTDVYWARQQVTERLQTAVNEIPAGVGVPELGPVTTGLGEIYQYVLKPKPGFENKYGPMELRTIQDWVVRRQLLGVSGVADVSSFGGYLKQYEIAVNPERLLASGVTINDVFVALEANNSNTGGAYIEKGPSLLFIRSEGLIGNLADIENIAIKENASGVSVLLRDVATVQTGSATRYGALVYNGDKEVAGAVVMMLKGGNSNDVIKNVKARIEQIRKTLPKGVEIEAFLDRTKMVNNAIGTVKTNLMEGALIVIFILVLFLGNLRAGLIVASVIPLAMLFAIILMNLFGVSGNLMSLGALDFGLIIDGAVIIVEAVLHFITHSKTISHHPERKIEVNEIVTKTAGRMMNSAVFGQIIILVVYLPVFALSGIEGKMFKPMAQTVTFALLGAFLLSLTYVPMMSALFMKIPKSVKPTFSDRMMARLEIWYQRVLLKTLRRKKWVLASSLLLLLVSTFIMSQLGGEFIPQLEEGDFAVETRIMTGSNLEVSKAASQKASKILMENFPEVIKVVAKIGSGEIPTDPMPIEAQDLMIILKDKSEWVSAKTFNELAAKMAEKLSAIPGVSFGFQYPVQMRFNELMTGARQDVVCKIFGENLDSLASAAAKLGTQAGKIEGVADVFVEPIEGLQQIVIKYNRPAIARYGVSISQINKVVNTAFAGQSAGKIFEEEKRFDLVVRLHGEKRNSLEDVSNLLIPTNSGHQIPLNQLAEVLLESGPNQIQREDAKRRVIVGFNTRDRDVESIVEELKQKATAIKLPAGYYITYGGAFENLQAAKTRLGVAVPISLLLIFILLYFAFGSVRQGLMIYSAIPLSAIGGIFALALRGLPFSISAGVGFIALFGVAVLNGIVLISEFRRLQSEGWTDLEKIAVHGTKIRLRPVLMTAAVASLGFLPMALSHGAGAEVQRPLATVVIGGLITATFLTLFVLPIIYILFQNPRKKIRMNNSKMIMLIAVCICTISAAQAQNPISLQQAIDTALANNSLINGEYQNVNYAEALVKTARKNDPLVLESEYGQFNSIYMDTRFSATQSFALPKVYRQREASLQTDVSLAKNQVKFKQVELIHEVRMRYFDLLNLLAKEALLKETDSIYSLMVAVAKSKLATGESAQTELESLLIQKFEAQRQYQMVRASVESANVLFNLLLNPQNPVIPDKNNAFELPIPAVSDTAFIQNHPEMQLAFLQIEKNQNALRLLQTQKLPTITAGYNNVSIQGTGADNRNYTTAYRFQTVQLALAIPVFNNGIKANEKALGFEKQKNLQWAAYKHDELVARWEIAWKQFESKTKILSLYQGEGMQSAEKMTSLAQTQYRNGEIDYLQLAALLNQAISVKFSYTDALYNYNQSLNELYTLYNP